MTQSTSAAPAPAPTPAPATQPAPMAAPATTHTKAPLNMPILALRVAQIVFAIIVLGLVGRVTNASAMYYEYYGYHYTAPGYWSFSLFAGAITLILSALLLASAFLPRFANIIVSLALDGFLAVVWFIAFIILAYWLGAVTDDTGDHGISGLQMLEAACVFGALLFLSFVAAIALNFLNHRKTKAYSTSVVGQPPAMQQTAQHPAQHPAQLQAV